MIPVILSGGSGSRLWPLSRAKWPKQFCQLFEQSLMQYSIDRLRPLGEPYFLTVKDLDVLTRDIAKKNKIAHKNIILEPFGRNTAPAIALLCHVLQMAGYKNEIVGVFPADQLIEKVEAFNKAVKMAEAATSAYDVVTLGIAPNHPATGYGYIELEKPTHNIQHAEGAAKVLGFREKPDLKTAQEFLRAQKFLWNAGMFVFRLDKMVKVLAEHTPKIWQEITKVDPQLSNIEAIYKSLEPISFDYAVMEKIKNQACVPCDLGWSDMGSWDQVAEIIEANTAKKEQLHSRVLNHESKNNFAYTQTNKTVAFIGCDDLIVADTADALLVMKKGQSQKVKEVYDKLQKAYPILCSTHNFEYRPWGSFQILSEHEDYKSKLITVNPGEQLSYQSHAKRAEHWIVISGEAEVVLDDEVHHLSSGEHIHIPQGAKHRMKNPGKEVLHFVEVQTGTYFGEDDIKRYQDNYNRV